MRAPDDRRSRHSHTLPEAIFMISPQECALADAVHAIH
jgi:hypothetical protein